VRFIHPAPRDYGLHRACTSVVASSVGCSLGCFVRHATRRFSPCHNWKEHWDRGHDAREAMVGGMAHSGRVIFAAGDVMLAMFLTFALSGSMRPKQMGIILGFAALRDALLVRLMLVPILLRITGRAAGGCRGGSTSSSH
jgi:MMPL family